MPAGRRGLGRSEVAQRRVSVSVVVLAFEVPDRHPGFEQRGPVVAVEALIPKAIVERFDVPVVPRGSGRKVG